SISSQALRFVNIAKDDWLVTGRRPGAITAAAIMLSLQLQNLPEALSTISEALNVSQQTIKIRLRELKDTLIITGQRLLPWGDDINRKNILIHLPDILRQLEFVKSYLPKEDEEDVSPPSSPDKSSKLLGSLPPPSFYKSEKTKD